MISAFDYAAVCIEDDKKGEQIIVFTTNKSLKRDLISKKCKEKQLSELYIPKVIVPIGELPVLATGKLNYRLMIEMARKEA